MSGEDEKKQVSGGELPLNPDGTIDVDRVRIKLLIICRNKKNLDPVATYLIRRGWETIVTTNLKESFKLVTVFKPDFVLVSVNIQSPKLASLPSVLHQTFRTPVITFGEASDTRTMSGMQTIQANHKLSGPVSGPSVHRRIKQLLQDTHNDSDVSPATRNETGDAGARLKISGKKKESAGLLRFSTEKKEGKDIFLNKAEGGRDLDDGFMAGDETAQGSENFVDVDIDALAAEFGAEQPVEQIDEKETASATDESAKSARMPSESRLSLRSEIGANEKDGVSAEANRPARAALGSVSVPAPEAPTTTRHGLPLATVDPNNREQFEKTVRDEEALIQSLFGESKVNQALKVIALKSALPFEQNDEDTEVLEECTIIPIKILRKMAYLVVVVTGTVQDEIQYVQRLVVHLRHDLAANFEMVSVHEEVRMNVSIDFHKLDKAEEATGTFSFALRTGRGAASLLLVYENAFNATVYEEERSPKARININELMPDAPVGVDIFLHLPKNDKDYLYLRPSSSISQEQKERLLGKDAKLFVDKKDIAAYKGAVRRNKTIETHVKGGTDKSADKKRESA